MAKFFGTGNNDKITPQFISPGVIAIPAGSFPGNAADELNGGDGNDTLDGGGGNDTLAGGLGNDTYYVDTRHDLVRENPGGGFDTVISTSSIYSLQNSPNVEQLVLVGKTATHGIGNDNDNIIRSNSEAEKDVANNWLFGRGGNDWIFGDEGNDTLFGGTGEDTLIGDEDNDQLYGGSENDRLLGGSENDTLSGGFGNDSLYGQHGSDNLNGGGDDDFLSGGSGFDGIDTLTGGTGADRFSFSSPRGSIDIITDFTWQQGDKIEVSARGFGGGIQPGLLPWNQFHRGVAAQDAQDRFIYNPNTGDLFFDADGIGGQAQVQFAELSPGLLLIGSDIDVV
ncbi:MAG: calcium-binding protein [Xenococcaceae cyanobacterium MO_188.B19]|nr:calcium-binding protein [Xenococcaceae cyanobacterium MO_188.B19]